MLRVFKCVSILFLLFFSAVLYSCYRRPKSGEELAQTYCSGCHRFTPPEMLDKKTWKESILPEMAFRMGITTHSTRQNTLDELAYALPTLPAHPLVSEKEFELITNYFVEHAPDSLPRPVKEIPVTLTQFETQEIRLSSSLPVISMIHTDSIGRVFVGSRNKQIFLLNQDLSIQEEIPVHSAPSMMMMQGENILCLEMGMMEPNDEAIGKLVELNTRERKRKTLIDSLKRPVYFEKADFNGDSLNDFVICEFGNNLGQLQVYQNLGNGKYQGHIVEAYPGVRKVELRDFNNDGKMDIIALLTQAKEQIILYTNRGNFKFDSNTLLSFPPVYGSSSFELNDFNNDGFFDILYTNGGNYDYSSISKPYHGVRVFLNNGHQRFDESWFYPMYGASWAIARDFDADGDLDIAAISFYPDFKKSPEQSFIYFENQQGKFHPFTTPSSVNGRWLVMNATDFDKDGDVDILLGALDFFLGADKYVNQWKEKPVSLLLLKNKLH